MNNLFTAERVSVHNLADNYLISRHLFAYEYATQHVKGTLLELGCGEGYGYQLLRDQVEHYVGIDKNGTNTRNWDPQRSDFFRIRIPTLKNIPSNIFDYVVAFQVIEHIRDDKRFLTEIFRVLKKGGNLILTTPNRLRSFTRNPWHIREYTADELGRLTRSVFPQVLVKGINSSPQLENYLARHKAQVEKAMRWDIFKMAQWMPRPLLRIPYDMMNQLTKLRMHRKHTEALENITTDDFSVGEAGDHSLDLLITARK